MIDGLGHGGAERVLGEIAPELARQGHDVQVIVLQQKQGNPEAERLGAAGVPVDLVPLSRLARIDQIARLHSHLRALSPDILHAHLQLAGIAAAAYRLRTGVPMVATLHTLERPDRLDRAGGRVVGGVRQSFRLCFEFGSVRTRRIRWIRVERR